MRGHRWPCQIVAGRETFRNGRFRIHLDRQPCDEQLRSGDVDRGHDDVVVVPVDTCRLLVGDMASGMAE